MSQQVLARAIAYVAHKGQTRIGEPEESVFEHVDRVAARVPAGPARCVGYLHDVIEDTKLDASDLLALGVDPDIVAAVELLTHDTDGKMTHATYQEYVEQILEADGRPGAWARAVKLADLKENWACVPRIEAAGQHKHAAKLRNRYAAALAAFHAEAS